MKYITKSQNSRFRIQNSEFRIWSIAFLAVLFLLAWTASAIAEDEFTVLAAQGNVKVRKEKSSKWDKLTAGMKLASGDMINLSPGSYIGLANKSGRTLEVKRPGEFFASDLSNMLPDKKGSISLRFTGYVLDQLNQSSDIFSSGDYHKDMSKTGATERSVDSQNSDVLAANFKIKSPFPAKTNLINPNLLINWFRLPGVSDYTFYITDRFDRPVFAKNINDTVIAISPEEIKLSRDEYYFWHVASASDTASRSDKSCFMFYTDDKIKTIQDSLNILSNEIGDNNSAVSQVILAMFFEENQLINEADKAFKLAIQKEPAVEDYRKLYAGFLKRNGR